MIEFALSKCDILTVLVCSSDEEHISGDTRKRWIDDCFSMQNNIEVKVFEYKESELPNTSESSREVSKTWSDIFSKLLPDHSLVITSEDYGDYVAVFMGIQHIAFDKKKELFPVSATLIRHDLFTYWSYLPGSVRKGLAVKVVILGTESTGKSTLTQQLAEHYNCTAVHEAGRDLIPDSNNFNIDDLQLVAKEHANRIDKATCGTSPLLIIDTDINITQSYSWYFFQKQLEIATNIINSNKADLYLYLKNDVNHIQDGTRLSETHRNQLDISHRQVLNNNDIQFIEIAGSWYERLNIATTAIDNLIAKLKFRIK